MGYEIQFRKSALQEIENALDYYLSISPNVGFLFDKDLEYALQILMKNPFFEIKIKNYRVLPLSKFPYIIIYTVHTINIVQSSFFLIVLFVCYDGIYQTKLTK